LESQVVELGYESEVAIDLVRRNAVEVNDSADEVYVVLILALVE
jgi:hypothetical protein